MFASPHASNDPLSQAPAATLFPIRPHLAASRSGSELPPARQLARMLDLVDYGVLLLEDGHVTYLNRAARGELDEEHPLQLLGAALRAKRAQDEVELREAQRLAATRGVQRLLILGDDAGQSVIVSVMPLHDAEGRSATALYFGKREICGFLSLEAFARNHGLTPAETAVLKLLAKGLSPAEIAELRGVQLCVVRCQINAIRQKTGAGDMKEVLQQLARLPPMECLLRRAA